MNISEVSAAQKKAVERDKGKADLAAGAEILPAGGMDMDFEAGEGRCGSSEPVICAT
jgi:hypothetical protein